MRIAILNSGHMDRGGTERVVANEARGLNDRGYEVGIFTPINNPIVFSEIIPSDVPLKPWWYTVPSPILKRTINRLLHFWLGGKMFRNYDLLIAHNQPGPYAAYKNKMKAKRPYITYIHAPWRRLYPREIDLTTSWASDYRERIMFLKKDYWYRIDKESILAADAHLANSRKIKEEIKLVYGVDAEVCFPGIDLTKYQNCPKEEIEEVAKKHEINEYSLLVVGRHAPQKRIDWIPTIISNLAKKFPKVQVIVTGKPNRLITPNMINKAISLKVKDRIKLVGSVPENELIALYHSCPVLIYNAVYEDFGLPPIEAMACGCVPVAWNELAGPCETIVDRSTGLLAKPYDLTDFSEKIAFLIENPNERGTLSRNGIRNSKRYDWSIHLNILETTIQKTMS